MVANVYMKFHYDRLHIDKALGNFRKSGNNKKNENNVCSAWGPLPVPKIHGGHNFMTDLFDSMCVCDRYASSVHIQDRSSFQYACQPVRSN